MGLCFKHMVLIVVSLKKILSSFCSYVPLDEYDEDNYKAKKLTLKSILLYLYFNLNPKLIKRRLGLTIF